MEEIQLTKQQFQARQDTPMNVPMSEIDDDAKFNCRGAITAFDVEFLAKDIGEKGLIQRPLVRPFINGEKKYRVVCGFSRLKALRILRWREVPVMVRTCTDEEAAFLNLTENLVRKDLNFIQEAEAIRTMACAYPQLDYQLIAERLGQNRKWVEVRLFALNFPDDVKIVIEKGWMNYDQILYCHKIKSREDQLLFARKIKEARERGLKVEVRKPRPFKEIPLQTRSRADMFAMQEHIVTSLKTNNFGTRCLAWAAGEISDIELFGDIANIADNEEIPYKIPHTLRPNFIEDMRKAK